MNIGLIGFGGVGKAFAELILERKIYLLNKYNLKLKVKYIIKSDGGIYSKDGINIEELIKFLNKGNKIQDYVGWDSKKTDIDLIIKNKDIDTLIELTSTNIKNGEPGFTHIKKALSNGINVVTGNKGPILLKYKELSTVAKEKKASLMVGCTTGGALPSITGGIYDVAGAEILSIEGILNGTSNFILTEMMENNKTYNEALLIAKELGIAENNPKLDVEGYDTASKMIILANVLMGTDIKLDDIEVKGITEIGTDYLNKVKLEGKKIKLLGKVTIEDNNIVGYVKPVVIDSSHPLYSVDSKNKGVLYRTDTLGDIAFIGGESGVTNAAASILRDIVLLSGNIRRY